MIRKSRNLSAILDTIPDDQLCAEHERIDIIKAAIEMEKEFPPYLPTPNSNELTPFIDPDGIDALSDLLASLTRVCVDAKALLAVNYSDYRTSDVFTMGGMLYTLRAMVLYTVAGQSNDFVKYCLATADAVFPDRDATWTRSPILEAWWDRPFRTYSYPEARALTDILMKEYEFMDLRSVAAIPLFHNLEVIMVKHVIFLQTLDETEHARLRFQSTVALSQILYIQNFTISPAAIPEDYPPTQFPRFTAYMMAELERIQLTNTQESNLAMEMRSYYLRPGERAYFRYANPTDKMTPPSILVKERNDVELEEINDFTSFAEHTPIFMFKHGSPSIRFCIIRALFEGLLLTKANISLRPKCLLNPDPRTLEQMGFAIVSVINVHLVYVNGEYLRPPQDAVGFWFFVFFIIQTRLGNQLDGKSLGSFVYAWTY